MVKSYDFHGSDVAELIITVGLKPHIVARIIHTSRC
jgi:hypothetical protein